MFKRILFGSVFLALLAACGGGGGGGPTVSAPTDPPPTQPPPSRPPSTASDPAYHLGTARFTTYQPEVLEQIGAHHAYARGLSGQGVRIGIEDSVVDYTQSAEFGNRARLLDSDGASLSYSHPFGDDPFSDVDLCQLNSACRYWTGNSQGDDEALNRWVRHIVNQDGWPTRDDSVFVVDEYYSEYDAFERLFRWSELPTPYGAGGHGTVVASVAAGKNLGVAPEAVIIPIAQNLTDDQRADAHADALLRSWIAILPTADRRQVDDLLADAYRDRYAKFDIINRSYGTRLSELAVIDSIETAEWFQRHLPRTLNAIWQSDRADAEKTILVYAAGNGGDFAPGLGALLPYGFPELRGHSLAVAATDPRTGIIDDYSNRCGPLPPGWNAARHGPHYCLVAPGTVRGLVPNPNAPGNGDAIAGLQGTSFAAPLVSGALALMMEHFRGTRGNTEVVKRMLDTADRSGRYAVTEIYGAGHLDLEAALSPVGALSAGRSGAALSRTAYSAPAAYGAIAQRAGSVEIAAFDQQDFPFWVPVAGLVSSGGTDRSPIPQFADPGPEEPPAAGLASLGLQWSALPDMMGEGWTMGISETSASLARTPDGNEWGYGFSFQDRGHLEGETSGAFGTDLRSGMLWTSRSIEQELGGRWTVSATGTLALDLPRYERRAIFRASPAMMSAAAVRVGTERLGLTVEQPLRAETGTGTFRLENGRIEDGRRQYDTYRIPLRPDAREVRMTLRHERKALGGSLAVEVGHSMNAGHMPGETETGIGLAYRMTW